jgi:hypothetical protein
VERYWGILDKLSLDALSGSSPENIIVDDNKAIRGYILLCEYELEMRENGYIADSTYKLWADGIQSQFEQPIFKEIWKNVLEEAEEHRTFPYIHLRRLLSEEGTTGYDPPRSEDTSLETQASGPGGAKRSVTHLGCAHSPFAATRRQGTIAGRRIGAPDRGRAHIATRDAPLGTAPGNLDCPRRPVQPPTRHTIGRRDFLCTDPSTGTARLALDSRPA